MLLFFSREVFSASLILVIATSFVMFSLRSAADVGSVVLQLTLSALLCPLLPALLVCEHGYFSARSFLRLSYLIRRGVCGEAQCDVWFSWISWHPHLETMYSSRNLCLRPFHSLPPLALYRGGDMRSEW